MMRWPRILIPILCLVLCPLFAHAQTQPATTPTTAAAANPDALPPDALITKDIPYVSPPGAASPLKLDLYLPPKANLKPDEKLPVLVRFAPARETPSRPAPELLAKNCALVYVSYLPDNSPLTLAFNPFPEDLHAAKAAIRWVRGNAKEYNFDPDRIGVWGAGNGATIASLLAMTPDQKDLDGNLGDFPKESAAVRTACLFSGTTDWRYAELYGDETVNFPGSPAYQLFTGNPKDFPDAARRASAVSYIRPNSPPILMITLASDSNRAMHLVFAETLQRAGVPSALYEEPAGSGAGLGGRAVDEARLDRTIREFFADTLFGKTAPKNLNTNDEIDQLVNHGLYKQARQIIEEQVALAPPGGRTVWLKKVREIAEKQTAVGRDQMIAEIKKYLAAHPGQPLPTFTGREILTDPDHIGEYKLVADPTPLQFDARANALRHVEFLNSFILKKDFAAADREAALLKTLPASHQGDVAITEEFLARYNALRAQPDQSWPANIKPVVFATNSGRDLYGFWFTTQIAGTSQRFRYIPAGKFLMGSPADEWSRLPDEPILQPIEIKDPFWLAEAPVTNQTWHTIMGSNTDDENTARSVSKEPSDVPTSQPATQPTSAPAPLTHFDDPDSPAINLSYAHAVNFLDKLNIGAQLPTSAQWEYACRAGNDSGNGARALYPVTGRLSDSSWFWNEQAAPAGSSPEIRILTELVADRTFVPRSTHPIKQKIPNNWGLYDMQGNVWEWCAGSSPDKPRDYHPIRGGSWISLPQSCRAARTAWFPIETQSWNLGLRILIPAQQSQ